ncbi:GntR family transcriptional regulator [Leucobacter sp. NPDC015123]|uniref:GntR family transcriptional regulator n=1 Tax=Leucobacter sp. NPDC015123 TaxID=3364129 RepID=UPI0036F4A415
MATKEPLQTISVAEAATNRLRESLFAGAYEAGAEVKDTLIADEYGIARPTARIAVQQLIAEGMLVREPGYSARVRTFDPNQVRDIFRVRKLIEIDSVRAAKRTKAPLDKVERALERFSNLGPSPAWAEVAEADAGFHLAVVEAGGSERLCSYFAGITNEIRLLLALPETHFGRGGSPYEEHQELFQLLAGDATVAEVKRAWVSHLDESRDFLIHHLTRELNTAN